MNVVLIPEEVWMNSQLSIARHYGRITFNGNAYVICNKNGVTIFELSDPDSKYYVGDNKAIDPGEPADLVLESWVPVYKKAGRDKLIELACKRISLEEAKELVGLRKKKKK